MTPTRRGQGEAVPDGDPAVGQRRDAEGRVVARPHRAHRRVEEPGRRAADGAAPQHRRRRAGRPRRARRRAARRARLPDRVLPALARSSSAATTSSTARSGRTSPSRVSPTTRSASATAYRIGEAEFEVTQPRVTCFRVGMRMGEPRLPSLLVAHHRPGFYLRVLTEGHVSAGDEIVRTARGPHALTVADVDALLYLPGHDRERLRAALDIPALSPGWQRVVPEHARERRGGSARPASRSRRRRPGRASAPSPSPRSSPRAPP